LNKNLFGYPVFLITGVPGVGKSLFLFYFIYRYIRDDRFTNNRFALEFDSSEYHVFTKVNNDFEKFEHQVVNKVSSVADDIVLSDIINPVEPGGRTKRLFIFSSPNPARYKQTMKDGFKVKYTMPTWDENELMSIADNCEDWYQRFILVGGVPRDIFSTDKNIRSINESLQTAITVKGPILADGFFKYGFGNIDEYISYKLIHINPPKDLTRESWEYTESYYSFASDYVFLEISKKFENALLASALNTFDAGVGSETYFSASFGIFFEKVCLLLVPIAEKTIEVSFFDIEDKNSKRTFKLPGMECLPINWEKSNLTANVLYRPRNFNFESGDAFCVIPDETQAGKLVLLVLQITVSSSHPIEANGLKKIYNSFERNIRENIISKIVMFVTPIDGPLNTKQPIVKGKNNPDESLSKFSSDFRQGVFKYRLTKLI
jgi:hypothetical protein